MHAARHILRGARGFLARASFERVFFLLPFVCAALFGDLGPAAEAAPPGSAEAVNGQTEHQHHTGNGHANGHGHLQVLVPTYGPVHFEKGRAYLHRVGETPYYRLRFVFEDGSGVELPNVIGIGEFGLNGGTNAVRPNSPDTRFVDFDPFHLARRITEPIPPPIADPSDANRVPKLTHIYFYGWTPAPPPKEPPKLKEPKPFSTMDGISAGEHDWKATQNNPEPIANLLLTPGNLAGFMKPKDAEPETPPGPPPDPRLLHPPVYAAEPLLDIRANSKGRQDRVLEGMDPLPGIVLTRFKDPYGGVNYAIGSNLAEEGIEVSITARALKDSGQRRSSGVLILPALFRETDPELNGSPYPPEAILFPQTAVWTTPSGMGNRGDAYLNELGVAFPGTLPIHVESLSTAAFSVFGYDDQAARLHEMLTVIQQRKSPDNHFEGPNVYGLAKVREPKIKFATESNQGRTLALPPVFPSGERFSESGVLNNSKEEGGFVIQPLDGSKRFFAPIYLGQVQNRGQAETDEEQAPGWIKLKRGERVPYAEGTEAIRAWIHSLGEERPWSGVGTVLRDWFTENIRAVDANKPETRGENATDSDGVLPVRSAFFPIPDDLMKNKPELRTRFWLQAAQSFQTAQQTKAIPSEIFVVEWPGNDDETIFSNQIDSTMEAIADKFEHALENADASEEARGSLVLAIDLSRFVQTKKKTHNKMRDILKTIQKALPSSFPDQEHGTHVDILFLLPESRKLELMEMLDEDEDEDEDNEALKLVKNRTEIPISTWIDLSDRSAWMAEALSKETRRRVSPSHVQRLSLMIRETLKAAKDPFDDWNSFGYHVTRAIKWLRTDLSKPEKDLADISRVVGEMMGARPTDPLPTDLRAMIRQIPYMFNADSPVHVSGALNNLEDVLVAFTRQLTNYASYGRKIRSTPLVFCFEGPPGSGKTKLVDLLAQHLPRTIVRTVNFSSVKEGTKKEEGGRGAYAVRLSMEESIIEEIIQAAEALRFAPEPLKILFLDEVTAKPETVRSLLAALGDTDAKTGKPRVDLSGFVVILGVNTEENEHSRKLETITLRDPSYPKSASKLLTTSLISAMKKSSDVADVVVEAAVDRVKGGKFYFRKRKGVSDESSGHVRQLVQTYEDREGFRLIIPDETMTVVNRKVDEATDSHRGATGVIETALQAAIADFVDVHGDHSLKDRIFLLRAPSDRYGNNFELVDVLENEGGLEHLLTEAYRLFIDGLKKSMHQRIGQISMVMESGRFKDGDRQTLESSLEQYNAFLNGISFAGSRPLFLPRAEWPRDNKIAPVVFHKVEFPFTPSQSEKVALEYQKLWSEETQRAFIRHHAHENPLFMGLMPNAPANLIQEAAKHRAEGDPDLIAATLRESLLSSAGVYFSSYQRLLAGTRLRPSDLIAGGDRPTYPGDDHLMRWAREVSYTFQGRRYQQTSTVSERLQHELALLQTIRTEWNEMIERLETTVGQRDRNQKLLDFGKTARTLIHDHCLSYPKSSQTELETFINKLNTGKTEGKTEAEAEIADREIRLKESQAEDDAEQSHDQVVSLGAAFHLDYQLRELIGTTFNFNRPEQRRARLGGSAPVVTEHGPQDANIACRDLLLAPSARALETIRTLTEKMAR